MLEYTSSPGKASTAPDAPGLPPFDPNDIARHGADVHWGLARDGNVVARCSLWWTAAPRLGCDRAGTVGHFAAVDKPAGAAMLEHACEELAARGCTQAVGPMDGSTWRRYRLLTERGAEPPFFLEPDNPDEWPDYFVSVGFKPLARYYSALCTDLTLADPRLSRVVPRMERAGIHIRSIDPARFESELRAIHGLSLISFRNNFLYTPIAESEFLAQYRPIQPLIRPEIVMLAEQEGCLVGFVFAVPDLPRATGGRPIDTIVVKSAAVAPGRQYAGLGSLLVARCHAIAHSLGYRRSIHALMHESNESRNVSGHYTRPIRGYTLYSRQLRPADPKP